jgi:aspartate/methionine/tyrosine aminotransferase
MSPGRGAARSTAVNQRIASCYSSSVAMDITARMLAQRTRQVALIHKAFANIPDILNGRGLVLLPLSERELAAGEPDLSDEVGAVFVTTPSNPTGWVLPEEAGFLAWGLIRGNRAALADVLAGTPARLADPGSRISVARLSLPPQGPTAQQLCTRLRQENVHTLPCGPFHRARRPEGNHQLRVALARPASDVTRAAQAIAKALGPGAAGHGTGW